jgi:hypothetical protein
MKALLRRTLVIVGCLPLALAIGGCASQGEGDRCDSRNGSADCKAGLTCKLNLIPNETIQGLCCPPTGASTVAACIPNLTAADSGAAGAGGGSVSTDSGEASTPEASSSVDEAAVEAGDDSSVDAAAD